MAIELISLVQVPGLRPQPDGSRIPGLVWKAEIRSPGGHSILKFYQDSEPTDSEIRTKMEPPTSGRLIIGEPRDFEELLLLWQALTLAAGNADFTAAERTKLGNRRDRVRDRIRAVL